MQIDYISGTLLPSGKASSVHAMKMAQAFGDSGHRVRLHARRGRASRDLFEYYGVRRCFEIVVHECGRGRLGPFRYARQVRSWIHRNGLPDLVYSRHLYAAAWLLGGNRPSVYESHSPPRNLLQSAAERYLFEHPAFEKLVVISAALASEYHRRYHGLDQGDVLVSHDGADCLEPKSEDSVEVNHSYGLAVGYAGSFVQGRGIDLILAIAKETPEIGYHLLGGPPDALPAVVPTNVHLYGEVPPSEVSKHLLSFDVLIAPYERKVMTRGGYDSTRWMSPMKIFEYMAAGKPILASDLPVIREVLTDSVNALLVDPDDAAAWVRALERLKDVTARARLGQAARTTLESEYTWRRRAERIVKSLAIGPGGERFHAL